MDTIVRQSCIFPHPRLRMPDYLPAARGKQLGLYPLTEIEEPGWDFPPRFGRALKNFNVSIVSQRLKEQERRERERDVLEAQRKQQRVFRLAVDQGPNSTSSTTDKRQPMVDKEADDDIELRSAIRQIEKQDQSIVAEQKALCAAGERMKERLALYGLKEITVEGNGNCQFTACGYFLGQKHNQVREKAIKWLRENTDFTLDAKGTIKIRDFLNTDEFSSWEDYCKYMSRNAVWGDHLTLIAIANSFDRNIFVVSSLDGGSGVTCIESKAPNSRAADRQAILLSHWHELHYNALTRDENSFC